jgi:hypothetical protein
MIDARVFGAEVAGMVKDYVGQALAPVLAENEGLRKANESLVARIGALEAREVRDGIDGKDGAPGAHGEPGERGEKGDKGDKGEPGAGVADALMDREGHLLLTLTDGKSLKVGPIVGRDGKDGLGFEDMAVDYDGERTLHLSWEKDGARKEHSLRFSVPLYRGTFASGADYEKGDCVTWGGSIWIAQVDAPEGNPSEASKDWKLAVKRGRNGKEPVAK